MNQTGLTTKDKIKFSLIGIIVLGGGFLIARKMVLRSRANNEETKTFEEGSAAAIAKQLKMAFENNNWFGWGTDKDALRTALQSVESKQQFREVMDSYARLYGQSLMRDLKDELKTTEYQEVLAILAAKPEKTGSGNSSAIGPTQYRAWAERLNAAFNIWYGIVPGTDEGAIRAVFLEIPTQSAFQQVGVVYRQLYGNDLIKALKSELEFWEYPSYMKIITEKPL